MLLLGELKTALISFEFIFYIIQKKKKDMYKYVYLYL